MQIRQPQTISHSITRRLQFCAGHRVHGHESKCKHPHGHNYVVYVTAEPMKGLDTLGRVIDFSVIKDRLGAWIDEQWDHAFLYWRKDEEMAAIYQANPCWKHFVMPENPTAENMAAFLYWVVCPALFSDKGIDVTQVVIHETENCYAEVKA